MEFLETIEKSFYKLIDDYSCESSFYPEEICFIPRGTEGVVIDCHTIKLIPNLSDERYGEIVRRELRAKSDNAFLLLIVGRIISFHISKIDLVRNEGCVLFEDDADRDQYFDERHAEMIRRAKENKDNASA